jgi:hypothetical protein
MQYGHFKSGLNYIRLENNRKSYRAGILDWPGAAAFKKMRYA